MKTIKLLSALLLTVVLFGCNNDDDDSPAPAANINGAWRLSNVSGGIAGIDDDFASGVITWTIDSNAGTVDVVNNNTDPNKESVLPTATYPYTIITSTNPELCSQNFVVDDVNFGCYNLSVNQLTLGQVEADGLLITLVR